MGDRQHGKAFDRAAARASAAYALRARRIHLETQIVCARFVCRASADALDVEPVTAKPSIEALSELVDRCTVLSAKLDAQAAVVGMHGDGRALVSALSDLELHGPATSITRPRDPPHELRNELLHRHARALAHGLA